MNINKNGNVVIRPTVARNVYVVIARYAAQAGMSPTKFIVTILSSWVDKKVRAEQEALNKEWDNM